MTASTSPDRLEKPVLARHPRRWRARTGLTSMGNCAVDDSSIAGAQMTFDEFVDSIDGQQPSGDLSDTLTSLWWDKKGEWDRAHTVAQNIPTVQGSAVHAYLHREEGVLWNADYWYSRAGRQRHDMPLEEEWKLLVEEMLAAL